MSEIKKKKNHRKKPENKPKPSAFKEREMVNPETGEFETVRDLQEGAIGIFVKSEEEKKKEAEDEAYKYYVRKTQFIQINRLFATICGQLKQAEFHCFVKTLPYIGFRDQPLMIPTKKKTKNNDDGTEVEITTTTKATATKLYEFWGVHKTTGSRYLAKFLELGLFEEIPGKGRTKYYKTKGDLFFKGKKEIDDYTAKIFQEKLKEVIGLVEKEVNTILGRRKKKPELYPLAVLGALMPFFHFQTYHAVHNFDEKIIVPEGKSLAKVLGEQKKILQHLKKIEVWRFATGSTGKPGKAQQEIFRLNLEILHLAGAVMTKKGKKSIFLIHPDLMFVSPETRDKDYYDHVIADFTQTDI